jgi:hypothetical protein
MCDVWAGREHRRADLGRPARDRHTLGALRACASAHAPERNSSHDDPRPAHVPLGALHGARRHGARAARGKGRCYSVPYRSD